MTISSSSSPRSPATPSLGYRAEIDGLRAIAVLAVVLFHARLGLLGGGYAGVDVFFVISGFLISRLIAEEFARSGRFSLAGFYERRIRRLFPALSLVVLATLIVGWFQLAPGELMALARSGFAALAFFSNLYFAKEAGYFQPAAESQPLLHTWSLGVEEQFYILAPFIIVGLLYLPHRFRQGLVGLLVLVSLVLAVVAAINQREASFFWPHTRAYELLIGLALGLRLVPLPTSELQRMRLATAGLVLVAGALVFLPPGIFFPGFWALIPCLGAAMVIAATEGGAIPGLAGRLLCAAPMRFFGKISYSLYLWHWPVLVYATLASEAHLSLPVRLGLIAVCVAISWASYHFIETPARHGRSARRVVQVFVPAAALMVAAFGFSHWVGARSGFQGRFGPFFAQALERMHEPRRKTLPCVEGNNCVFGATTGPIRFLVWGDSHAGSLAAELGHLAAERGVRGVISTAGGCPTLLNAQGEQVLDRKNCKLATQRALRTIDENPGIVVIFAARWAFYAEGARYGDDEQVRRIRRLVEGDEKANRVAFSQLLVSTIEQLRKRGAEVRIIGPVPEFPYDVLRLSSRRLMKGHDPKISIERAVFDARQQGVKAGLDAAKALGVKVFYPHEGLCDASLCLGSRDGVPLYIDSNHLTAYGASLISAKIAPVFD